MEKERREGEKEREIERERGEERIKERSVGPEETSTSVAERREEKIEKKSPG